MEPNQMYTLQSQPGPYTKKEGSQQKDWRWPNPLQSRHNGKRGTRNAIRIFPQGEESLIPVYRTYPQEQWTLYTDGACLEGNTSRARAGAGTFCLEDGTKNYALRIPGPSQTNQRGELMAIVKSLSFIPKGMS